jgi:hypothetical protein
MLPDGAEFACVPDGAVTLNYFSLIGRFSISLLLWLLGLHSTLALLSCKSHERPCGTMFSKRVHHGHIREDNRRGATYIKRDTRKEETWYPTLTGYPAPRWHAVLGSAYI